MGRRTFQSPHYAIKTLGTELIVAERSQELADDDVCLFTRVETPHVRVDELDLAAPLESGPLLQDDERRGVLLDRGQGDLALRAFCCPKTTRDERTSSRSDHENRSVRYSKVDQLRRTRYKGSITHVTDP